MHDPFGNNNAPPKCPVCQKANWDDGPTLSITKSSNSPPDSLPMKGTNPEVDTKRCSDCGYLMMFLRG